MSPAPAPWSPAGGSTGWGGWLRVRSIHYHPSPPSSFKQQNLEQRQADVEYELRCLLNKPGEEAARGPVCPGPPVWREGQAFLPEPPGAVRRRAGHRPQEGASRALGHLRLGAVRVGINGECCGGQGPRDRQVGMSTV